jgi:hypothetical protein
MLNEHTSVYVCFMRLLAGISLVEGGGVLLIPVAHRGGLLSVQTPKSLSLLR